MSKKRGRRPGQKRKSGQARRPPVRQSPASVQVVDRKLSEVIKEMATQLLRNPEAGGATAPATAAILILAGAAWNSAIGDNVMREQHRRLLDQIDWEGVTPWSELRPDDTEQLIAELVEYKQEHFPNDLRRIEGTGLTPDGNIRVQWTEPEKVVTTDFKAKNTKAKITPARRRHPIADKLLRKMKRYDREKVVDLDAVRIGKKHAEDLQKTVATREDLAKHHPAHALYVYAQNQTSVMSEQLTMLKELERFANIITKAEDEYLPSGPPMSPLTPSFFTCWAFFDACGGLAEETVGSIAMAVGSKFGMHDELLRVIGLMQASRMGVYTHEGVENDMVVLREMVTERVLKAICPSGYLGRKGELWYARVLQPAGSRFHRARSLHHALRAGRAGPARLAGLLSQNLARRTAGRSHRRLRAPHEVRADARVLDRVRVRGLYKPQSQRHLSRGTA